MFFPDKILNFTDPVRFEEAAKFAGGKQLLPTTLSSAELSALGTDVKQRAVFSARLSLAEPLQSLKDNMQKIVSGDRDEYGRLRSIPEAKAQLREAMVRAGYMPQPGQAGTLLDHLSDARRSLIVETNVLDTLNFGRWESGQDQDSLDINPGWELVRMRDSKVPRDWESRWDDAGGEFFDGGRMIALKNDPVWQALGDGDGGYEDTLGNPWPPFAFNSGMSTIDVSRKECVELGVMEEDDTVNPIDGPDLNENLEASADQFDKDLLAVLEAAGLKIRDGILSLVDRAKKPAQNDALRGRITCILAAVNDGTSAGALKGWETRRAGIASINSVLKGETHKADYAEVTESEAARIQKETGRNVRGFKHSIDQNSIRHISNQHGPGRERRPGQSAITHEDFAKIPEIVSNPDKIESGITARGLPAIKYTKKIGTDHMYVEEEWSREKRLMAKTFYKKSAILGNRATSNEGVVHTSETSRIAIFNSARLRTRIQALCAGINTRLQEAA